MNNKRKMAPPSMETNSFSQTWGKLIQYCKPYLVPTIASLLASAIASICTLMGPDKLGQLTNLIGNGLRNPDGMDFKSITSIGIFMVCIYLASLLLSYFQGFTMATVTQSVTKRMRSDISKKINKLPLNYFDTTNYGDILSRVTNDVDTIGQTLNQGIGSLISAITMFVGAIIMMVWTNWILALVAIASSLIGFLLIMFLTSHSQKYFRQQQELLGQVNGHVEEVFNGHTVIKAYNAGDELKAEFMTINEKLRSSAWKSQFMSGMMMPLMSFIGNLGYVAVCVAGAVLAMKGQIEFGTVVAFIVYVRLFTQPLAQVAQAMTSLQSAAAASYRVFDFLEEEELSNEENEIKHLDDIKGDVSFENVYFGYNDDKIIINDFSASITAGQKIAIVGPTGAGKTTLVNLLMKFYEVNAGEITIDDSPLSTISREAVHDAFCMVLQDTWIFEGTVRENMVYNEKGISEETLINVSKSVGLHHFIRTLPQGYDTVLDDNTGLSSGQRQLITIARAMIKNSPMLILDEATSSVDTRTELLIQEAMDKLMKGRTSFVIAHRLSTIKNADLILVMDNGQIIEQGSHDELIAKDSFYANLYNSQFSEAI